MKKIIIAAMLFPSIGFAEPEPGSRVDTAPKSAKGNYRPGTKDAEILAHTVSRCVADRRRGRAAEIVNLPFRSKEQATAASRLTSGEEKCMGHVSGTLTFNTDMLVMGMAEELFLMSHRRADINALIEGNGFAPRNSLEELGLCVARAEPVAARAILDTPTGSASEDTAIRAVVPALGPCVSADVTLKFSKPVIRGLIALALYHSAQYASTAP
ncbi:hypothetical protein [Sphingosinicella sp.]|uniref:hypothetical protein n=1 Tax=Sphingosinicella sp. TaxID=1917971 RepID=UPI002605F554|nr:hypothetical protein [Sphingosinicella sp.]